VRWTIEEAVARRAPEVARVEVEGVVEEKPQQTLLQISPRPPDSAPDPSGATGTGPSPTTSAPATSPAADVGSPAEWHELAAPPSLGDGESAVCPVADAPLLLIRLPGNLYAYHDRCTVCSASLADAVVDRETLHCASCSAEFDIRRAGRGEGGHLEPVPLLEQGGVVRVALPAVLTEARP
jgi:nitrite reductase/ring-hydroxylating ferredoxin subunit